MKIKQISITKIIPYENNPRDISEKSIEKVKLSIKEFGFQQPIVVDKDNIIIVGHTRLEAAKQLKFKKVPVVIANNLTNNQTKAYRLMDNRASQESNWDERLLKFELSFLKDENFDLNLTGFEDKEIDLSLDYDFNPNLNPELAHTNITDKDINKAEQGEKDRFAEKEIKVIQAICPKCFNEFEIKDN